MRLRRMGCEDLVLEGISPALRAMASDFSLRGQRKVTKRKVTLADSLSFVEYPHLLHIPADHEHQFRFNVNTISGPM